MPPPVIATSAKRSGFATCLIIGLSLVSGGGTPQPGAPAPTATVTQAPGQSAPSSEAKPSSAPATQLITVPDVSGMGHQDAQDTIQAAGLYNLREVDGKGRARPLIIDRNWVQTEQFPAVGTKVTPDTAVTLTAVKYTDK
jgi:hypothetical protein